jgi:hypothetical protein
LPPLPRWLPSAAAALQDLLALLQQVHARLKSTDAAGAPGCVQPLRVPLPGGAAVLQTEMQCCLMREQSIVRAPAALGRLTRTACS